MKHYVTSVLIFGQFVLKNSFFRSLYTQVKGESDLRLLSRAGLFVASFLFLLFLSVPYGLTDRMIIPVKPDVSVYEPGQKAIVAWNGREEALILSTDVNSDAGTFALEIMPLPSNPKTIEEAGFDSFQTVESLIWANILGGNTLGTMGEGREPTVTISITFHERIGAHDITVVNVTDASHISSWAESFLQSNGIPESLHMQGFEPIINDYLKQGFHYFVFDLIETSQQQNTLNPILYKFETSFLYYPLRISSLNPGNSKIVLFLITEDIVDQLFCHPFTIARYYYRDRFQFPTSSQVQFRVTAQDLNRISPEIGKLFKGSVWFTALEYEGEMKALTNDFEIHSFVFPLSHFVEAIPIALIEGFTGSGVALVAYGGLDALLKKRYPTQVKKEDPQSGTLTARYVV